MKLPLSVLMYQLSDDYGYETVNVDISSQYEGIKLFDDGDINDDDGKYLYIIEDKELEKKHSDFLISQALSSSVFICICKNEKSAVCTTCRDLSVVFLYADVKFAYIFNHIQNIMKKFDEWEKSFHLSLLRNNDMQELVDITEELITHPLIILDNNYTLLAHTHDMSEVGPLLNEIIKKGYASPHDMHRLVDMGVISSLDSFESPKINLYKLSDRAVAQRGLDRNTFYSITYRFIMGGVTLGYAIAFHCLSHPTKGYLYLMNMISEKLQLFFERQKQDNSRTEESYQTFLAGILGNPDMSERQVSEQAGHIAGLHTEGKFLLAQLQYNRIDEMSYSFISWSLRNSMPQFMPFVYRNSFYILKDCSRTEQEGEYSFVTEKEKPLFAKCFKNIDYACGISGLFFSLKKLSTAAVQCREALSIGQSDVWHQINADFAKSDDHSGSKFYRYDDISFVYILSQLRKVMSLESMESPYFKLLKDYDRSTESNLCGVMAQYILCGCSVTKTAAKTYMHRNTILNKVRRAGQIMGNSLEDFTSQVFFMMSYVNNLTE